MKIGLEMYTLREAFAEDPASTLERVAAMGYGGVEFSVDQMRRLDAATLRRLLDRFDLACYGYQHMWTDLLPDRIEETLAYNEALGNTTIAVGSAPPELLETRDGLDQAIEQLQRVHEACLARGMSCGYHNHAVEFSIRHDGRDVWSWIFDAMPDTFRMVLDTGNAVHGGADLYQVIEDYPGRMPVVHIKPYHHEDHFATMIGDDDTDWPRLLRACQEIGGSEILMIEYGNAVKYTPFESAALCRERLLSYL